MAKLVRVTWGHDGIKHWIFLQMSDLNTLFFEELEYPHLAFCGLLARAMAELMDIGWMGCILQ
jgi:hypothetical protein